MKTQFPDLFHALPLVELGQLVVRLATGEWEYFHCKDIAAVLDLTDCCGGYPVCHLHHVSGKLYRLDHPTSVVYALWDAWRRGEPTH